MATVQVSSSSIEIYVSPYFSIKAGGIPNYDAYDVMPTSWLRKYGGHDYSSERRLFKKLVTECYNLHGVELTYFITSYDTHYDRIWGEDCDRRFIRKFDFMAKYQLNTEEKMWTKFAIEGIDNFSIFVSKEHFRVASTFSDRRVRGNIGRSTYASVVPKSGDIIQSKYNNYLYEIITVKEEAMMPHLSKEYVWELIVSPFRDDHIKLDSATSASMDQISAYTNKDSDIFNIKDVLASAVSAVDYQPETDESDPRDPWGGW